MDNQELQDLDHLTDTLSLPVQDIVRGEVQIPTYRLFEIDQMMQDDTSLHYQRSEELKKWIEDFQTKEHEFDVPGTLSTDFKGLSKERISMVKVDGTLSFWRYFSG